MTQDVANCKQGISRWVDRMEQWHSLVVVKLSAESKSQMTKRWVIYDLIHPLIFSSKPDLKIQQTIWEQALVPFQWDRPLNPLPQVSSFPPSLQPSCPGILFGSVANGSIITPSLCDLDMVMIVWGCMASITCCSRRCMELRLDASWSHQIRNASACVPRIWCKT